MIALQKPVMKGTEKIVTSSYLIQNFNYFGQQGALTRTDSIDRLQPNECIVVAL